MRLLCAIGLGLLAFGVVSCTSSRSESDVIARVNGLEITVRDYMSLYESMKPRDVELQGVEKSQIKNIVIQALIRRAVIITNAQAKNIEVSEKELVEGIQAYKSGYSEQMFQESLLEGMVDETEWKEQVRQNLLIEKLFEVQDIEIKEPSIEEALAFFEKNPQLYEVPAEIVTQHIVVGDEELAKQIRKELRKNISKFKELARQHSIGPEAKDDAIIRVEKGSLEENIDRTISSIPIKRLSQVVKTDYGYHLFRVLERTEAVNLDFSQVKEDILEQLKKERRLKWIEKFEEELIRAAQIEYNRELIREL